MLYPIHGFRAFSENGPYYSPDGTNLAANPGSWHQLAHMLFLDRPAGAGYSFSRSGDYGKFANDNQTAIDTVAQIRGILERHPWLCNRTLYVAGESYAGHFTIELATALLDAAGPGDPAGLCVEVGGVMAGNAVVDINQTNYAWFENGYSHSLIDGATWAAMQVRDPRWARRV